MNVDNIRLVAKTIREHERQFNLQDWAKVMGGDEEYYGHDRIPNPLHSCDTCCCIGGWVNAIIADQNGDECVSYTEQADAADFLGLSDDFVDDLFCPSDFPKDANVKSIEPWDLAADLGLLSFKEKSPYSATAEEAAQVLEAIADGRIQTY